MPYRRDSDSDRLPEGMRRVGYDADTQRYTFVDEDGKYYQGPEGARYGVLQPIGGQDERRFWSREDEEAERREGLLRPGDVESGYSRTSTDGGRRKFGIDDGESFLKAQNRAAYRYLLPFILICCVVLFVLFRFLNSGTSATAMSQSLNCPESAGKYVIKDGDICIEIAKKFKTSVETLISLNMENGMDCNHLDPGSGMCVPGTLEEQV